MQFLDSINYDVVEPNLTQPTKAAKMLPNPTRVYMSGHPLV